MNSISTKIDQQVAHICLVNPSALNAIDFSMGAKLLTELQKVARQVEKAEIRALVIESEAQVTKSRKIWIAGGHLGDLWSHRQDPDTTNAFFEAMNQCTQLLTQIPVPVILRQDGWAIGGGAELALCADIRFVTKDSGYDFKQLRNGVTTGFGGCRRLVQLVGLSRAQDLLLRSLDLHANSALQYGLVHEVFTDLTNMDKGIQKLLDNYRSLSEKALAAQKQMLNLAANEADSTYKEFTLFLEQLKNPHFLDFLKQFQKGKKS